MGHLEHLESNPANTHPKRNPCVPRTPNVLSVYQTA